MEIIKAESFIKDPETSCIKEGKGYNLQYKVDKIEKGYSFEGNITMSQKSGIMTGRSRNFNLLPHEALYKISNLLYDILFRGY